MTVNPSETEIVFNSDTNSYALSLGVKIQLPIAELVEVLLKFNQEQVVSHSSAVEEPVVAADKQSLVEDVGGILAALPAASRMEQEEPVPPPGLGDGSQSSPVYTPKSRGLEKSSHVADDGFARISITVARQEPALLEYRQRAKWTSDFGKFFAIDAPSRIESNLSRMSEGFDHYGELPVHPHFLDSSSYQEEEYTSHQYHPRSGSMDSNLSSSYSMKPTNLPPSNTVLSSLSADAPVFTPGSAFASTAMPSLDSLRIRAMSDTFASNLENSLANNGAASRNERAMSLAYLPPSALSVMREEGASNEWAAPELERGESRPAECKQM